MFFDIRDKLFFRCLTLLIRLTFQYPLEILQREFGIYGDEVLADLRGLTGA